MRSLLILALVAFTTVITRAEDNFSLCDSALSLVGLTCEDVRFDQDEMANWGVDLWRTSYFTMFHKNPLKLPKYGQLNLQYFSENVRNITALLSWAGARIDCPVRRGLVGDQLVKYMPSDSVPKLSPFIKGDLGGLMKKASPRINHAFRVVQPALNHKVQGKLTTLNKVEWSSHKMPDLLQWRLIRCVRINTKELVSVMDRVGLNFYISYR
jgi:hypothetical protein